MAMLFSNKERLSSCKATEWYIFIGDGILMTWKKVIVRFGMIIAIG